jgi:chemotaxis family two-component system response regulator Rcp1
MTPPEPPPFEILLVEDSPSDAELTVEAMREARVPTRVTVVEDGVSALEFLRRQGVYARAQRPDLILLDLNLPRKDGREVLAEVKTDDVLKSIPVLVLTTSRTEADVVDSYRLHANCYIEKPLDFDHFLKVVRTIEEFWFHATSLPPNRRMSSESAQVDI